MEDNVKFFFFAVCLAMAVACADPSEAKNHGRLPNGAVPMTPAEVQALLAGKTIDYKVAQYYLLPDGTLKGINQERNAFADGTWHVKGNEYCLNANWHGADKAAKPFFYSQCKKFSIYNKVVWVENSKDQDQYLGDIYSEFVPKELKPRDLVSRRWDSVKKKLGY
jgi:hypothetical protein